MNDKYECDKCGKEIHKDESMHEMNDGNYCCLSCYTSEIDQCYEEYQQGDYKEEE